jgi:hypothetical protein
MLIEKEERKKKRAKEETHLLVRLSVSQSNPQLPPFSSPCGSTRIRISIAIIKKNERERRK